MEVLGVYDVGVLCNGLRVDGYVIEMDGFLRQRGINS